MLAANTSSRTRVLTVVAATVISLSCGTNYVYSAWGPQFARKLKLSSTESNLIGTFGNLGNYASGIPFGMMIDAKGPRWGAVLGAVLFALGYYPLAKAFDAGPGSFPVALLCIFSSFTGAGSSAAYGAAIKAAALSFPETKGTATAFPIAAYGLSAFFFATVALAFPHDTSHFLLVLATGTVVLPLVSFPFLRMPEHQKYDTVPQHESSVLRQRHRQELSRSDTNRSGRDTEPFPPLRLSGIDNDDTASLYSNDSLDEMAGLEISKNVEADRGTGFADLDIRGVALIRHLQFWQLFGMLGLLAGIGLMTINNIGNDVQALWQHYDPATEDAFIAKRQAAHVSTLSVCSFTGRLLSGIGSDILVNKYNQSRYWCLLVSAILFAVAQIMIVFNELPDLLLLVAVVTGIAYGILWGVFPSLVANAFGVRGLSQNFGTICLAPMISGYIFNVLYGKIFDVHTVIDKDGNRECLEGRECYSKAYLVTWTASLLGVALCYWSIYCERRTKLKRDEHHRVA